MDVNSILDLARSNTHTTVEQIPNATAILWLNLVYSRYWNKIIASVNENYNFEIWKEDTIIDQDEYLLPTLLSNDAGAKKVKRIGIKYTSDDDDYTKAREISLGDLERDWEYYVENQSSNDPIFFI